jgi:DNA adenine methylase
VLEEVGKASPVLRWAGGKRRLVPHLVKLLPTEWNTYAEPMAGSAALFFYLAPEKAVLADVNPELINFYRVLRNDTRSLIRRLTSLKASKDLYYKMRRRKAKSALERAVRFAYLNRLCWNGLHRVNREGNFNVPMGSRLPRELWERSALLEAARLLKHARLVHADFGVTLRGLGKRDFAFIDPPYPRGASDGYWFNRYSKNVFTLEDHRRLGRSAEALHRRGALMMILLASDAQIMSCYPSLFKRRDFLESKSLISGRPSSRGTVREVVLTNYA